MLSADLHSLAAQFYEYRDTGIEMKPAAVDQIVATLIDLSQRAQALESCAIAPASRHVAAYDAAVENQKRPPLHVIDGGRK